MLHRPLLIFQHQNLISLDGIPVLPEERTKAELYFYEQQQQQLSQQLQQQVKI